MKTQKKWNSTFVISLGNMSRAWRSAYLGMDMVIVSANMRGDDIYNLNQLVINYLNDLEKKYREDGRSTFMPNTKIVDGVILVQDQSMRDDRVIFKIYKEKI